MDLEQSLIQLNHAIDVGLSGNDFVDAIRPVMAACLPLSISEREQAIIPMANMLERAHDPQVGMLSACLGNFLEGGNDPSLIAKAFATRIPQFVTSFVKTYQALIEQIFTEDEFPGLIDEETAIEFVGDLDPTDHLVWETLPLVCIGSIALLGRSYMFHDLTTDEVQFREDLQWLAKYFTKCNGFNLLLHAIRNQQVLLEHQPSKRQWECKVDGVVGEEELLAVCLLALKDIDKDNDLNLGSVESSFMRNMAAPHPHRIFAGESNCTLTTRKGERLTLDHLRNGSEKQLHIVLKEVEEPIFVYVRPDDWVIEPTFIVEREVTQF